MSVAVLGCLSWLLEPQGRLDLYMLEVASSLSLQGMYNIGVSNIILDCRWVRCIKWSHKSTATRALIIVHECPAC